MLAKKLGLMEFHFGELDDTKEQLSKSVLVLYLEIVKPWQN